MNADKQIRTDLVLPCIHLFQSFNLVESVTCPILEDTELSFCFMYHMVLCEAAESVKKKFWLDVAIQSIGTRLATNPFALCNEVLL